MLHVYAHVVSCPGWTEYHTENKINYNASVITTGTGKVSSSIQSILRSIVKLNNLAA